MAEQWIREHPLGIFLGLGRVRVGKDTDMIRQKRLWDKATSSGKGPITGRWCCTWEQEERRGCQQKPRGAEGHREQNL